MSNKTYKEFNLLPIAAAVFLTCSTVYAQTTPEVQALISPDNTSISVGVGGVNNTRDAIRFGQYTGLDQDVSGLVDFEMIRRDEAAGTLTKLKGVNLGLDTRELSYSRDKQGDWKYALDYNEIVRNDPYVVNTGMTGIGSNNPTIKLIKLPFATGAGTWAAANGFVDSASGVSGSDVQLKLKRTAFGLTGEKWISPDLQMELSFRNEKKEGARLFGKVGMASGDMQYNATSTGQNPAGNGALLLTPEPIDSVIRSLEGKLNFNRGDLALTAGYYGSFYVNNYGSMTAVVPGVLNRGALWANAANTCTATTGCTVQQIAQGDVALAPDNQAHQLYVDGTYRVSPTARASFKLSYTHATQDESFVGMGLTPSATAPANLGGVVDTTLAQLGLSARPSKELTINASLRYENRDDKTTVAPYNGNPNSTGLNATTNWPSGSQTRTTAKVDGIYRLGGGTTANLGLDWERKDTPLPIANTALFNGQVFFRSSLDEYGVHAGLRKAMSDALNGGLSVELKQRRGDDSDWWTASSAAGTPMIKFDPGLVTTGNRVLPDMYMDRDRAKVRGNIDWDAGDKLSLQVAVEHGQDDYKRAWAGVAGTAAQLIETIPGARTISNDSLTIDANYKLSDSWNLGSYFTHSENRWNVNKASLGGDTRNASNTFGLNVRGKVNARLSIGAGLVVAKDQTDFQNYVTPTVANVAIQGNCAIPNATGNNNADAFGNICGFNGLRTPGGNFLPDINYNTTKLNMFGRYELDKKSSVLVNVVYQKFESDDWQWGYNGVPFVYSDNTTVSNPNQTLTFLGVSYNYKF